MLLPRDKVVECYVKETNGVVTDFCSFYHLPSTVFKCDKHNHLSAVYSYYNVATTMTFQELMLDSLVLAKIGGVDVFNALDLGENKGMFEELQVRACLTRLGGARALTFRPLTSVHPCTNPCGFQFGAGDGHLQYYVYNWNCPQIEPAEVGLVLV